MLEPIFFSFFVFQAALVSYSATPLTPEEQKQIVELKQDFIRPALPVYDQKLYNLGHALFFDDNFSTPKGMSCGTCHQKEKGWSDGLPTAKGRDGQILPRKSQSLWNIMFDQTFFWDGRAKTVEDQIREALHHEKEMAAAKWDILSLYINEKYGKQFKTAFPNSDNPVTEQNFISSIAAFVKAQISPLTTFDEWIAGNDKALTLEEQKGFLLFNTKANCTACHISWRMADGMFNDIGLPDTDTGRGAVTKNPDDNHFFKTPSLRDIKNRAPYMHNGMFKTLEEVIDHYDKGTFERGETDIPPDDQQADDTAFHNFTQPLNLTEDEKKALIAFLKTL